MTDDSLSRLLYSRVDPYLDIQRKIYRSGAFAKVLGVLIDKRSVMPKEVAELLRMNRWAVNRELLLMESLHLVIKRRVSKGEVRYIINGSVEQYREDVIRALDRGKGNDTLPRPKGRGITER